MAIEYTFSKVWRLSHACRLCAEGKPTIQARYFLFRLHPPILAVKFPGFLAALDTGDAYCGFEGYEFSNDLTASPQIDLLSLAGSMMADSLCGVV